MAVLSTCKLVSVAQDIPRLNCVCFNLYIKGSLLGIELYRG